MCYQIRFGPPYTRPLTRPNSTQPPQSQERVLRHQHKVSKMTSDSILKQAFELQIKLIFKTPERRGAGHHVEMIIDATVLAISCGQGRCTLKSERTVTEIPRDIKQEGATGISAETVCACVVPAYSHPSTLTWGFTAVQFIIRNERKC